MKKAISISFFIMLFISQTGYYFFFTLQQRRARREMKAAVFAGIPQNMLKKIEYNNRIQWQKKDKEFFFDGELYDIVKTKTEENKTVYYCINDKKEHELMKRFARAAQSANDHTAKGKGGKGPVKFQFTDITAPVTRETAWFPPAVYQEYYSYNDPLTILFSEIATPPPKA